MPQVHHRQGPQDPLMPLSSLEKLLTSLNDNVVASTQAYVGKEKKLGTLKWDKHTQEGFRVASSQDPAEPIATITEEQEEFFSLPSGTAMCQQFQAENGLMALETDVAKMNQVRRGHFVMNMIVTCDSPVSGPSILSCAPSNHSTPSATLARLQTQFELNNMSSDDVMLLSSQRMHIPADHMGLIGVFEHYDRFLLKLFTADSHTYRVTHKFLSNLISEQRQGIGHLISVHGPSFCFSLLANIHITMAAYINKCFSEPKAVGKSDLDFEHIKKSIQFGNFMNLFKLPYTSQRSTAAEPANQDQHRDQEGRKKRKNRDPPQSNNQSQDRARAEKVINSYAGTTTGMPIRKFMLGRKKFDPDFSKCPKVGDTQACLRWFQKGSCDTKCPRKASHIELAGSLLQKVQSYIKNCEEKANNGNESTQG